MTDGLQPASVPADGAGTGDHVGTDRHADGHERQWLQDLFCGAAFLALGLAFAIGGSRYEIGSAVRMGPGYLPIALGGALALLGLTTVGQGVLAWRRTAAGAAGPQGTRAEPARTVPWARGALVIGAIVFFGLTIEGLGIIPTVFVTALLAALAGQHAKILRAVLTAVGVTLVSWLIFVVALQLRLPLFGDWLGG